MDLLSVLGLHALLSAGVCYLCVMCIEAMCYCPGEKLQLKLTASGPTDV